jgi:phage terminase large subunit-like protein
MCLDVSLLPPGMSTRVQQNPKEDKRTRCESFSSTICKANNVLVYHLLYVKQIPTICKVNNDTGFHLPYVKQIR